MNTPNLRLGLNFSTSPTPPTPLVGLQIPIRRNLSTSVYLTAQPKDAYFAAMLRPQVEFFRNERLIFSAYAEAGAGYFLHGLLPSFPGGAQVQTGLGLEGCILFSQQNGFCTSVGYGGAWMERAMYNSPSSLGRREGWDGRNLLSIGLTIFFGI